MEGSISGGASNSNASNGMNRAERFEDEKRRIIESCFGKKDSEDGSLLESYITHIRITEDAAYPSSPPPPNSSPETKKPRLIIVAVRKSGRVRMHKARENGNGTFSIGKTWMLDDLTGVKSYTGVVPANPEEENHKKWAGGQGFTVNIGKPYYWQANTAKEKSFFIASLVKIFTKYTGGKSPVLDGFDAKEMDTLLGVSAAAARPVPPSLQPAGPPQPRPPYGQPSPRNGQMRREVSNERMRPTHGQVPPLPGSATSSFTPPPGRNGPSSRTRREDSPAASIESSSTAPLRKMGATNHSQESFGRADDNTANSVSSRSWNGQNGLPSTPGRFQDRSMTPNSLRAGTPDSSLNAREPEVDAPPVPAPLSLPPERRRPPMPNISDPSRPRNQPSNENIVPAPLISPNMRRDDLRPPTRSSDRSITPTDIPLRSPRPEAIVPVRTGTPRKSSESATRAESFKSSNSTPTVISTQSLSTRPSVEEQQIPEEPVLPQVVEVAKTPAAPPPPATPEEDLRPGLGPMVKKKSSKDIASTFARIAKTANTSANGFKPRAGGAAERLRGLDQNKIGSPDIMTEVVPAPSLVRGMSAESTATAQPAVSSPGKPSPRKHNDSIPEVKITVPPGRPTSVEGPVKRSQEITLTDKPKAREPRRPKPVSETMQKELASLGVDSTILGGRGSDLVELWEQFGWVGDGIRTKNMDQMQDELDRELNKVQAGGWLSRLDEEDDRIEGIKNGLDKCIEECEELDGLLTLYSVELSTLNEDIAYIEAQSQGLQVQTANQRLLQAELKTLLDTISISSEQLGSLREASLESPRGLEQIESSLVTLFKAMLTIDPSLSLSAPRPSEDGSIVSGKPGAFSNSEIGSMRVLQEKKDVYRNESAMFLRRLRPFLQVKFGAAVDETRKALEREKGSNLTRAAGKVKLDPRNHDLSREVLWRYSPLMLFAREVDKPEWEELIKTYETICKPLYQDEFRDATFAWKRIARKPTGDEADILFTSQVEKQEQSITTTARKLTVKRSQTLAKSLRSPIGDNSSKTTIDRADGRLQPYEVFNGALDEMVPIISMEQNFIVEFFHVTSLDQLDFPDAVASAAPDRRQGADLKRPRVMDPNRDLAKLVIQSMEEVYSFFAGDIQLLVDWSVQADPLQGVGVIVVVERKLVDFEESSQEFLSRTLQKIHSKLISLFDKFLDEQIRAIEDTKVKIKKRKGVIGFIRIFPSFSLSLETMLASADDLEIRETVNRAYVRINKAMFESLKVIARENPAAQTAGADPEDKEVLNYQILLIENMNHYLEEVDARSNTVLEDWKQNAVQEMEEHMSLYLGAVIRRPLGKLLDFIESTESLMLSRQPGEAASSISSMPSHSKTTFKKILAGYDSKEIKRGIETLKKRVEKHFGDADDPGLSRGLVSKVIQNCEKYYEKVEDRILTISRDVYDGDIVAEWTKSDVSGAFRK